MRETSCGVAWVGAGSWSRSYIRGESEQAPKFALESKLGSEPEQATKLPVIVRARMLAVIFHMLMLAVIFHTVTFHIKENKNQGSTHRSRRAAYMRTAKS